MIDIRACHRVCANVSVGWLSVYGGSQCMVDVHVVWWMSVYAGHGGCQCTVDGSAQWMSVYGGCQCMVDAVYGGCWCTLDSVYARC